MTATTNKFPTAVAPPTGLRVTKKLLDAYRDLQDAYDHPQLDSNGINHDAERHAAR